MNKQQVTKESFTDYRFFDYVDVVNSNRPVLKNFVTYLTLSESELYRINDLNCHYDARHVFKPNYTGRFSINFTRKGFFTFETYKRCEDEYVSRIMLEKPGCEFRFIQQESGDGGCTVLSFSEEAFALLTQQHRLHEAPFFSDPNMFSVVITADAEADWLHSRLLSRVRQGNAGRLEIDCLVTELVERVMHLLLGRNNFHEAPHNAKRFHFRTMERAKEYLLHHFAKDISLLELARHCYTSHFHFTRLFKQLCGQSPFSYLRQLRLKHAETLLKATDLPVTDICFQSGFSRTDYFSDAFTKQYGVCPTKYKRAATKSNIFFSRPVPAN